MPVFTQLSALYAFQRSCTLCDLRAGASQVVAGDGVPTARIVFCGEAPGAEEDAQGIPFVGASGQLLSRIMAAMGLDRTQNAYIINLVKCRPPNNRPPTADEVATCLPHAIAELGLLPVAMLVTLGATATHAFLPNAPPIGQIHGQWQTWQGIPLMPTYHPAAMLRKKAWAAEAWQDMVAVITRYRLLVDPNHYAPKIPHPPDAPSAASSSS
jgi:uracil-DNA glycosylase family 4